MATIIYSNGKADTITPKQGQTFTLQELQEYVDGYIQLIPLGQGEIMILNEEGKLLGLPDNESATTFWRQLLPNAPELVGNVIIAKMSEMAH